MKFLVITHVVHKKQNGSFFAYGPYVKEMNLWMRHAKDVTVVAPILRETPGSIDLPYLQSDIHFIAVNHLSFVNAKKAILSLFRLPAIFFTVVKAMRSAEHIHIRCPGNMGLIACIAQVFFPEKTKTVKYAANWDPGSRQPFSYRVQRSLISNTFLSKRMTGLVYGSWPGHTRNIKPFFTASYTKNHLHPFLSRATGETIELLFVGVLLEGKRPLLSAKVCKKLNVAGVHARLHIYGEGREKENLKKFAKENNIEEKIFLYGNQPQSVVEEAYKKCQFLIFLSRSEGWPKVVAEAMWWGCLPITSPVSCVPEMIGYGDRGDLVYSVEEAVDKILFYRTSPETYLKKSKNAAEWSRQYTLEYFESEIQQIIEK